MTHAKKKSSWTAAGGEAPRRFRKILWLTKAVLPLRSATAIQKPLREEYKP
jgi:hypothetical protein